MEYTSKKILLIRMDDDHGRDLHVVPPMTIGTVEFVDGVGQLHVKWEGCSSSLAVIPGVDIFRILE